MARDGQAQARGQQRTQHPGQGGLDRLGTFLGPIALGLLGCLHGLRRARPVFWLLAVCYLIMTSALALILRFIERRMKIV